MCTHLSRHAGKLLIIVVHARKGKLHEMHRKMDVYWVVGLGHLSRWGARQENGAKDTQLHDEIKSTGNEDNTATLTKDCLPISPTVPMKFAI
jgi:hypothetical protein